MLRIDVNLLDRMALAAKRYPHRASDILQSIKKNQLISKQVVVDHIPTNSRVCVMGGWYALAFMLLTEDPTIKYTSLDLDSDCTAIGNLLSPGSQFEFITANALNYVGDFDVYVNCSTEHMDNEQLLFAMTNIETGKLCIFQNNNNFNVPDHINCFSTLEEYVDYLKDYIDIQQTFEDRMDNGTTRFTIIGNKSEDEDSDSLPTAR